MAVLILFSCLLLSLSVGIDCSDASKKNADGCSQDVSGTSEVKKQYVKFSLFNGNVIGGTEEYTLKHALDVINPFITKFYPEAYTKILVHEWNDVDSSFNEYMKIAYLKHTNYNIILANWNDAGGLMTKYEDAKNQVPRVAEQLGIFIERLCSYYGMVPNDIHVIGYGLGAHIAGLSGKYLTKGKIGRVTGLDPRSGFSLEQRETGISNDSARFVDIIHTCGGRLGISHQIGHADFFPNGGSRQPGCRIDRKGKCRHKRAFRYYAESLRYPKVFLSTRCNSWSDFKAKKCEKSPFKEYMGEFAAVWASGRYYLHTNNKKPFSKV